ncbi:MAG: metallophosphoesterase [Pseudomonadota bacterium]
MTRRQRLIQITDTHLGRQPGPIRRGYPDSDAQLAAVLSAVRERETRADQVLLTGDLAEDPHPETYARLLGHLTALPSDWPITALAGNHDDHGALEQALGTAGHGVDGHVILGDWLVVGLNSAVPGKVGGRVEAAERARLDALLGEYPGHWALIAVHHPVVPVGSAWMDRIGLENPKDLFAVLDRHPQVRGCLFGHIHQAFRGERHGIDLLGCPATCVQFAPHTDHLELDSRNAGYRVVELGPNGDIHSHIERVATDANAPEARHT